MSVKVNPKRPKKWAVKNFNSEGTKAEARNDENPILLLWSSCGEIHRIAVIYMKEYIICKRNSTLACVAGVRGLGKLWPIPK